VRRGRVSCGHVWGQTMDVPFRYVGAMLEPGDQVPDVRVWTAVGAEPVALSEALGDGRVLLCFYLWDWSPT
jgi:hypothetical protein